MNTTKTIRKGYNGISYPTIFANALFYWIAERWLCPRGWHLLDEVWAGSSWHTLVCDACDLRFTISPFDQEAYIRGEFEQ